MFTHTTLIKPKKINHLYETKVLQSIPMCPRERLVLISISTGLSFAKKGLGHFLQLFVVFITCTLFCCFIRKPLKIRLLSTYRDFLLHTTSQHLLLLVGIDTPIYRKYCDTHPILVGHQDYFLALLPGSEALLKSGTGKGNFYCEYFLLFLFVTLFPLWITHLVFCLGKLLPLLG